MTNVLVSSCTCQDTLPLLSKGGNQGALVLVKLNFQTPSPFITHFFSCFHLSLFQFDPRPLVFVLLIQAFSSCFSYELFSVSTSNLATHIVGSLKKGKSLTPIPATTYNTLPSNHSLSNGLRTNSESGMINNSQNLSLPPPHKRSPSSDSGNAGSRSHTPVSYHMGEQTILSVCLLFCPSSLIMSLQILSFVKSFPLTICTSPAKFAMTTS